MKFDKSDLTLIDKNHKNILINVKLNNIDCGIISITTAESLERSSIILSNYILKTEYDFFILLNDTDLVVMFTDHEKRLMPQYIPLTNTNQIELVCSKPFLKNLIANRGIDFYGID